MRGGNGLYVVFFAVALSTASLSASGQSRGRSTDLIQRGRELFEQRPLLRTCAAGVRLREEQQAHGLTQFLEPFFDLFTSIVVQECPHTFAVVVLRLLSYCYGNRPHNF